MAIAVPLACLIEQSGKCRTRIKAFRLCVTAQRASWHPPVRLCSPDTDFELNWTELNTERLLSQQITQSRTIDPSEWQTNKIYSILTCDNFLCSNAVCFVKLRNVTSVTANFIQGVLTWGHESFSTDEGNVPCLQESILDFFLSYLNIFNSLLTFLGMAYEEKFGNKRRK